jgi:lysophospholipid acyltransferase (LPLAT)-like uncharacterized protein
VRVISGWQRGLATLAGLVVRVWSATLDIRTGEHTRGLLGADPRTTLFVLWHNRLFVSMELCRRLRPGRPLHGLVSSSKDGAWLAAFFESAGLRAVRGSSSRGGREAASALVEALRGGDDAGLTPDGPRGPIYGFKPGALVIARRARPRVVLLGIAYADAWQLPSWDRFLLPHPFSRVRVGALEVPLEELEGEAALAKLEAALRGLNPDGDDTRHAAAPVL